MIVNSSSTGNKRTTRVHKKVSINGADEDGTGLRRGPWTLEEDNLLNQYISCHGEGRWNSLAKSAGLNRTGKSCRLRWLNYLKPDIKRGNLTPQEQLIILELHAKWGNRWARIAQNLPGRTDSEIKNYWRTRVQKQARQLKVDSNSKKFLEAIRLYWVPRLMEKIEQNSAGMVVEQGPFPMSNPDSDHYSTASSMEVPGLQDLTEGKHQGSSRTEDCNRVDVPTYQVQGFESRGGISFHECHVGEIDWFGEDIGSTFWNTDDLWQFRTAEEVRV